MTDLEKLKEDIYNSYNYFMLWDDDGKEIPDQKDGIDYRELKSKLRIKLRLLSNKIGNSVETYVLSRNLKAGVPLDLNAEETTLSGRAGDLE